MTARYAVYFLPDARSQLARFGAGWLGWDVHRAKPVTLRPVAGVGQEAHRTLVAAPSVYGFHATLKAPMRLAPGVALEQFLDAVSELAASRPKTADLRLVPRKLGRFLALTQTRSDPAVAKLADLCVKELDRFRAPLTPSDRQRRRPEALPDNQRVLLERWGFPFVFEEYRFHMTLTGPLDDVIGEKAKVALETAMMPVLEQPAAIDALSVVVQSAPGTPFRLLAGFPLRGCGCPVPR